MDDAFLLEIMGQVSPSSEMSPNHPIELYLSSSCFIHRNTILSNYSLFFLVCLFNSVIGHFASYLPLDHRLHEVRDHIYLVTVTSLAPNLAPDTQAKRNVYEMSSVFSQQIPA